MFLNKQTDELSSNEYIMRYCRSKNYNFQQLLNDPLSSFKPSSETYSNNKQEPIIESI